MKGAYESARDLQGPLALDTDVVVIGSGASGAVVATELAESGQRVIVLEEGPRVSATDHGRMRTSESLRHAWRDAAMTVAAGLGDTPSINVMMGRVVGGSSMLTGGVCFRIPDTVMREWTEEHGLPGYTPKEMEPFHEHVEKAIHVETVPESMRSRSTNLFVEGARKLGREPKPLRRNTDGCQGCGTCNFGCPHEAKRSVDLSYLPRAVQAGAQVWSHCLVDKVRIERGRAVGVRGRLLNGRGGGPGSKLDVRAKRVVVACGAWHSPLVLMRSGLGLRGGHRKHLGKHLTLHPGFRVIARFDDPVRGWQGSMQAAYDPSFEHEDMNMVGLFAPPGAIGAIMPGVGAEHTSHAAQIDHLAIFGGMLHDQGGGVVRRGPGREPFVTYRMHPHDRANVPKLLRRMAETFFAAGAREVFLPVMGMRGVGPDELAGVPLEDVPGSRIESSSQHPLGTCRMSVAPERGVVNPEGKVWGVDDLYVVDGGVLPTSLGVNPQVSIMTVATRLAWRMRETPLPA